MSFEPDAQPIENPAIESASMQGSRGFWQALILALAGLLIFVLVFNFLVPDVGGALSPEWLIALGLLLALVPAALWLVFFYAFDSKAPEPRWLVLLVFAGGAVLCAALHGPLLGALLPAVQRLYTPWWIRLIEATLIAGVLEVALIYLAVRVLAFHRAEFDERVDGVIYGVAAGLGLATVINFAYVTAHGGVDLDVGSVRMVINTLAYGSAGGVMGYFIGQARFERVPWYYLPEGLLLSAAMLGALFTALEPGATGLEPRAYWMDLALAAAVAILAMVIAFVLIARANEESERIRRGDARPVQPPPAQWRPPPSTYVTPSYATPVAASVRRETADAPDRLIGTPVQYPPAQSPPAQFAGGQPGASAPDPSRPEKGNPNGAS